MGPLNQHPDDLLAILRVIEVKGDMARVVKNDRRHFT